MALNFTDDMMLETLQGQFDNSCIIQGSKYRSALGNLEGYQTVSRYCVLKRVHCFLKYKEDIVLVTECPTPSPGVL